jgi:excisionase family DNA binding protein
MLASADTRRLLTVKEVASRLCLHPMTVRRMIAEGRLPAIQLGGPGTSVRIAEAELEAWLFANVGGSASSRPPANPAERRRETARGRLSSSQALAGQEQ